MTEAIRKLSIKAFPDSISQMVIEHSPEIIIVIDRKGTILAVNNTLEKKTGWKRKDLIGKSVFGFNDKKANAQSIKNFKALLSGKQIPPIETTRSTKSGKVFPIEYTAFPIKKNGKVEQIAIFGRDITKRKDLQKKIDRNAKNLTRRVELRTRALQREKAESEAVLKSMGEGIVLVDKNRKIKMINHAACRMIGWHVNDALGKRVDEVLPIVDEDGNLVSGDTRPISLALSRGQKTETTPGSASVYHIRKNGSRFPVAISTSPVMLSGKLIGAVSAFRDITIGRELDKAKKEFVSLASHQLRTPLSISSWYLEKVLGDEMFPRGSKERGYMETIYEANRRMVDLVDALLHTSRIEMGTLVLEPEPTPCQAILEKVYKDILPTIEARQLTFEKVYEGSNIHALVDPKALSIVCENLLTNACRYTPVGGKIKVVVRENIFNVEIEISDNGYGIPEHQQHRIFTKLFRADNVLDKDTEGTGLGLYIVKSIVEKSKGTIKFESAENKGTTFHVSLPK